MSLKFFHIFFIALSISLIAGFGVWQIRRSALTAGLVSFAGAFALAAYLTWFIRKLRVS